MTGYLSSAIKGYAASYAGLPKACWEGITLTFINAISVGICFFLTLYFVDILHFNMAAAGLMISFYGLGTVVGGLIGGELSDRVAPRIVSILSLFVQATAFLLLVYFKNLELLITNLFVLGVAAYGFKTSNNIWILNQCKAGSEVRLKTISISHVASNLGLGLSGVIIGALAGHGFQNIFYLSSGLLCISAIYLLLLGKEKLSVIIHDIAEQSDPAKQNKLHTSTANKRIVALILICVFLIGLIIAQLSATYPIYIQDAFPKLGVKAVSILFILDTVLIVLFQAPLIDLVNNYNKILIVGIGAFLMGLGMLVLSFSFVFILAIISCAIWTTGEMLFVSMAQLVCYEKGGEKKKGQSIGVFQATFAASSVTGPAIGGVIYQYFGGNTLWYLSAAIGILCLIACNYHKKYI